MQYLWLILLASSFIANTQAADKPQQQVTTPNSEQVAKTSNLADDPRYK